MNESGGSRITVPSEAGPSPEGQSRLRGYAMIAAGWTLTAIGTILVIGTASNPILAIGRIVVGGFVIVGGIILSRRGRRHVTRTISSEITTITDGAPFVLYLRTFADDDRTKKYGLGVTFWRPRILTSQRTEEEQLRAAVRPFGELIAVGRPGEHLPELGARRLYLPKDPPDAWKPTVLQMMKSANLVLVNIGPGESLRWEVEQVVKNVHPEHLLLIVPTTSVEYDKFKDRFGPLFQEPLPDYPPGARKEYYNAAIRGAIYFDSDGASHFVRFDTLQSPGNYRRLVESHFINGLRPVYARLPVAQPKPWRRLLATLRIVVALALMALIVFLGWQLIEAIFHIFGLMFESHGYR